MQKEIDKWAKEDVAIWAGSLGINNLAKLFFDAGTSFFFTQTFANFLAPFFSLEINGTNLQNINVAILLDCGLNLRDAAFVVEQSRKLTEGNFECKTIFFSLSKKCFLTFCCLS